MDKFGLTVDEADRRVTEMNRMREAYVKRHWHRNWLAQENYHLCLNTSWLGIEEAAELVIQTAKQHLEIGGRP
jgi:hypothetical protein